MAEVLKTTRTVKLPDKKRRKAKKQKLWGRWRSGVEAKAVFADRLAAENPEEVPYPEPVPGTRRLTGTEMLPEAVEVDAERVMKKSVPKLPSEPREVVWEGRHLFTVMVAYECDPLELFQAMGTPKLVPSAALDVSQPTCYWCGQVWSLRNGRAACSGVLK